MVLSAEHQCNWPRQLSRTKKPKSRRGRVWRCSGERWRDWLTANKGNEYVRTTLFSTRVTSPKHVSLLAAVRSLGLFPSFSRVAFLLWPVMPRDSDSDTSGALPGCLHCMSFFCARVLHLPARFCVCQPVCLGRYPMHAGTCVVLVQAMHARVLLLIVFALLAPARVLCIALG